MKTPLELVKSKVQEACGDVMNLEFGCEIIHNGIEQTIVHCSQSHPFWFSAITDRSDGKILDFAKADVTRLGREIRLADVLRTFKKPIYLKTLGDQARLTDDEGLLVYWDCEHDSLSWHAENRPETVALLAEVLK